MTINNGSLDISDPVYLINYLLHEGDAPADIYEYDCDGFPGLNYGDFVQLIGHQIISDPLYSEYSYNDYPVPSSARFSYNTRIDFSAQPIADNVTVYVKQREGFKVADLILPFSFAAEDDETELNCTEVSFAGTVGNESDLNAIIDNDAKIVIIRGGNPLITRALPEGARGLFCTIYFESAGPISNPTNLEMTSRPSMIPMLLYRSLFRGITGERVYLPTFMRARYGDCNSDGKVNISDAVFIINYVFVEGLVPGINEP